MNTHIVYGMSFLFQNDLENSNSNLKGECHGDACESDAAVTLTAGHAVSSVCVAQLAEDDALLVTAQGRERHRGARSSPGAAARRMLGWRWRIAYDCNFCNCSHSHGDSARDFGCGRRHAVLGDLPCRALAPRPCQKSVL
jgi:hypothetical protein